MNNVVKCDVKHCRNEFVMKFLGKRLCDGHWEEHCQESVE